MAEALAKDHFKCHGNVEFYSAGTKKHGMNELAVQAIQDLGLSMDGYYSKTLDEVSNVDFNYVITVCSNAHETCPIFNGEAIVIHKGFDDPPHLAKGLAQEESMKIYRRVRDEIKLYIVELEIILKQQF